MADTLSSGALVKFWLFTAGLLVGVLLGALLQGETWGHKPDDNYLYHWADSERVARVDTVSGRIWVSSTRSHTNGWILLDADTER